MELLKLLAAFFVANMLGYGGGPASIPLIYEEVVNHHEWLSNADFSNVLALGNALPGPITTKIAAYVGYDAAGWLGAFVSLIGTVLPSAVALIILLNLIRKYRQSSAVKGMTLLVQPVIAIMMLLLTWQTSRDAVLAIGVVQFAVIAGAAWLLMKKWNCHPALLIGCAFVYGGLFLS